MANWVSSLPAKNPALQSAASDLRGALKRNALSSGLIGSCRRSGFICSLFYESPNPPSISRGSLVHTGSIYRWERGRNVFELGLDGPVIRRRILNGSWSGHNSQAQDVHLNESPRNGFIFTRVLVYVVMHLIRTLCGMGTSIVRSKGLLVFFAQQWRSSVMTKMMRLIPMIVSFKGPGLSCLVPCGASLGTGTPRMIWQCQSLQGPMNLTHWQW